MRFRKQWLWLGALVAPQWVASAQRVESASPAGGHPLPSRDASDSVRATPAPAPGIPPAIAVMLDSLARELASLRREVAELRALHAPRAIASPGATLPPAPIVAPPSAASPVGAMGAASPPPPQGTVTARPVESGFGTIRVGGLLQAWYTNGSLPGDNSLRIRRAELKLAGKVSPRVSWTVMIDPSKALSLRQVTTNVAGTRVVVDESVNQSSRVLQDAFVSIALPRGYSLDVGQYKLPFAYEGPNPTAQVITVERPMFDSDRARGGGLSDVRDIGATLRGKILHGTDIALGLFDGSGEVMNTVDPNDQKVVVGKASVPVPLLRGLTLGMSGIYGATPNSEHPRRDRLGAMAEFARAALTTRAEYVRGADGDAHRAGYYGLVAYRLTRSFELVHRIDFFDPDLRHTGSATVEGATDLLAGLNYYIAGHNAKLQLNGVQRRWRHDRLPDSRQLLLNMQTSW